MRKSLRVAQTAVLLWVVLTGVGVPFSVSLGAEDEATLLSVADVLLKAGDSAQTVVSLVQAPRGLQSADIALSIGDPTIAQFTDIAPGVLQGDAFMILRRDAGTIEMRLFDLLTNQLEAGVRDQVLAKLTVKGLQVGRTPLRIEVVAYVDDQGNSVAPQTTAAQIEVMTVDGPGPVPPPQPSSTASLFFTGPARLAPDAQGVIDLILVTAPEGLQRYDVVVHVSDPTVVKLESATTPTLDPRYTQVIRHSDGALEIRAVDFSEIIQPGAKSVLLAEISLTALRPGSATLVLEVQVLTDDAGRLIPAVVESFPLVVMLPPVGDSLRSPRDLDGDGLYEDINGDGQLTVEDALLFAFHYDTETVQKFSRYYDFNGDGLVNFADAQRLLQMILQQNGRR